MPDKGSIEYRVTANTGDYDRDMAKAKSTGEEAFDGVDRAAKKLATTTGTVTTAQERLTEKIGILRSNIERQSDIVAKMSNEYGVNSEETEKARLKLIGLQDQLESAEKKLASMTEETGRATDATKDLETSADKAADDVDDLGDAAKGASDDIDDIASESADASRKIGEMSDSAKAGADTITSAYKTAVTAIGAAVVAAGGVGIAFNAQMEEYQTSFEVMTGSYETAASLVEELKTRAAATPFELTDLAETTQLLMNYGFTTDNVVDSMNMLGDIAQGDAEKMKRIAAAYGQMSSAGKVSLEDIKQMIEAGFNPLQEITESTGESMESLYERISDGTISVDEITNSMKRSTSEGGKYFQSMQKQSETLKGKWSTLQDTAKNAFGEVTKGLSDWLASDGIPAAIKVVEWLADNFRDLVPWIATATAAATVLVATLNAAKIVDKIKEIGAALSTSLGIVGLILAAVVALGGAIQPVIQIQATGFTILGSSVNAEFTPTSMRYYNKASNVTIAEFSSAGASMPTAIIEQELKVGQSRIIPTSDGSVMWVIHE